MADKKETADGGWLMENCHKCDPSQGAQGAHGIMIHQYCTMPSVNARYSKHFQCLPDKVSVWLPLSDPHLRFLLNGPGKFFLEFSSWIEIDLNEENPQLLKRRKSWHVFDTFIQVSPNHEMLFVHFAGAVSKSKFVPLCKDCEQTVLLTEQPTNQFYCARAPEYMCILLS